MTHSRLINYQHQQQVRRSINVAIFAYDFTLVRTPVPSSMRIASKLWHDVQQAEQQGGFGWYTSPNPATYVWR